MGIHRECGSVPQVPQEGHSPAPELDMDTLCQDSDPAGSRGLCSGKTPITARAPGCVHQIPATPAGSSGLCSQLPVGKRCQPGGRRHTLSLRARPTRRCLFGMACAGGRAGRVARVPCHGHGLSRVLCPTVHPLEVALWRDSHRAGRRGLVRGHRGQELRVAPGWPLGTGAALGPACLCPGAPPRFCCPFPRTHSSRNAVVFSASGAGSLSRCFHIPPGTAGCSCGVGATGRAGTPGQPPGNQGLSPQPRVCQGQREVPHSGTAWPCPS